MMTKPDAAHFYQRTPSVGMPRHALRRRMPNISYRRGHSLGGGFFITTKVFFSGVCGFGKNRSREIWRSRLNLSSPKYTTKNDPFFSDLETQPYDFAENLHAATKSDSKNYFLLTLFRNFFVRFPPAP